MKSTLTNDLSTMFIGRERIHLASIESTNLLALDLLSKSKPSEGTVISTDYQLMGRGQIGRYWYGSAGLNAMCSVILYPKFISASEQFLLSIVTSCAIRELVEGLLPSRDVKIKWPNDIYIDDKKVAGLLIQNSLQGSTIAHSILGIGINVNEVDFPESLPNPTSIFGESQKRESLELIYAKLFSNIEHYYLRLRRGEVEPLRAEYISQLYKRGDVHEFRLENGENVYGIIQHVDRLGKLIVSIEGKEQSFAFRELTMLFDP